MRRPRSDPFCATDREPDEEVPCGGGGILLILGIALLSIPVVTGGAVRMLGPV